MSKNTSGTQSDGTGPAGPAGPAGPPGTGSVNSVALTVPPFLTVSGSPITTSGTLSINNSTTPLGVTNGGTGLVSVGSNGQVISSNGTSLIYTTPVSSVGISTPPFLSVTNSPITSTGTIGLSLSGTPLPLTSGGTGLSSVGYPNAVLTSDGTNVSWAPVSGLYGIQNNYMKLLNTTSQFPGIQTKNQGCTIMFSGNAFFGLVSGGQAAGTVQVFNLSNPLQPQYMSTLTLAGTFRIVAGVWPLCYVPSSGGQFLFVINLSNPFAPVIQTSVKVIATGAVYNGVYLSGFCYCATQNYGLAAVDVTTTPPTVTFNETPTAGTVAKEFGIGLDTAGNLYTTDYRTYTTTGPVIKTWTLSGLGTPSVPSLVSSTTITGYVGFQPLGFSISTSMMFLSTTSSTIGYIMIISLSTPSTPTLISTIQYPKGFGSGLYPQISSKNSNYLYVPSGFTTNGTTTGRIDLYDITNPSLPVLLSTMSNGITSDVLGGISVYEGYIYCGAYGAAPGLNGTLQVFSCAQEYSFTAVNASSVLSLAATGKKIGSCTLASGTFFQSNTTVTSNSKIIITVSTSSSPGFLSVSSSPGVGFTINSSNALDSSSVNWIIIESQ